jgi:hypothetical protein
MYDTRAVVERFVCVTRSLVPTYSFQELIYTCVLRGNGQ